jgi:aminomethyltransferase
MTTTSDLLRTPFYKHHLENGAKMVDFAGWEMPLHYGSIIEEHHRVRNEAGIFDVSHMGRFSLIGRDARAFLDHVCTRQIWGMKDGQARYSMVCNEQGGVHDDVLVYRVAEGDYRMVCNASNRLKLIDHFNRVKGDHVFKFEDQTLKTGMIAVQGPKVMEIIGRYDKKIPDLKRYHFLTINVLGMKSFVSRTGYTGEDGVEVIFPTNNPIAKFALKQLLNDLSAVPELGPAGLGARDSLRLEAGMALYGHEIDEHLDPVSAGIMFAIKINKGEDPDKSPAEVGRFIGQDALQKIHAEGPERKLVGLYLDSKRAARQGMTIHTDDVEIGVVTSGCQSPTLQRSIAMGYVRSDLAEPGTTVQINLGKTMVDAEITSPQMYKRD